MSHPHHGHGGGFRRGGSGFVVGYPMYAYPCDPLDPSCPYAFGEETELSGDLDSRPAGSMSPVGCDGKLQP